VVEDGALTCELVEDRDHHRLGPPVTPLSVSMHATNHPHPTPSPPHTHNPPPHTHPTPNPNPHPHLHPTPKIINHPSFPSDPTAKETVKQLKGIKINVVVGSPANGAVLKRAKLDKADAAIICGLHGDEAASDAQVGAWVVAWASVGWGWGGRGA